MAIQQLTRVANVDYSGHIDAEDIAIEDILNARNTASLAFIDQTTKMPSLGLPASGDASGNGNHGTYFGKPTLEAPGSLSVDTDGAVVLDGPAGDYIDCGTAVSLELGDEMTIEFFMTAADLSNDGSPATARRIVGRHIDSNNRWQATVQSGGRVGLQIVRSGITYSAELAVNTVVVGAVYHIAITFNLATPIIYINGVAQATGASGWGISGQTFFWVGRYSATQGRFQGSLDEMAYYNTALSADRIAAHYAARLNGTYAAEVLADRPAGYWRLGDQYLTPAIGHAVEVLHGVELWPSTWTQSGLVGFTAAQVNNGDVTTKAFDFNAAGVGSYLRLDCGAGVTRAFRAVRCYASAAYTAILNVEYSDDGAAWTAVVTDWNAGQDAAYSSISWAAAGAHRYWRIYKTNAAAAGGDIYEVQFSTEPSMVLFHGTIDDLEFAKVKSLGARRLACELVDWNQLADRHLIAQAYTDQTAGAIVGDVITNYLAADGVVASSFVEAGPLITKFVANYLTARQLLDDLGELIGYAWTIDYDKRLHWFPRETNVAPFTLDGTTLRQANLKRRSSRDQYRNVQYVRAGKDLTDAQTESFKGDGSKRTWNVGYPVAQVPTNINVNGGAAKTVGIRGVDSGKQFYWNKDSTEITQDQSEPVLATTDVLTVVYVGLYDVIVAAKKDSLVAERQAVEGGSGLYAQLENFTNLDGQDLALDKARGLLKKFGRIPNVLSFSTDVPGLQAGMLATANLSELKLSGQWLIESVRIHNMGTFLRYECEAVDGEHLGGWVEFWKKFYESDRQFVARENEVINSLVVPDDPVAVTDAATSALATGLTGEWGVDEWGTGEWG